MDSFLLHEKKMMLSELVIFSKIPLKEVTDEIHTYWS